MTSRYTRLALTLCLLTCGVLAATAPTVTVGLLSTAAALCALCGLYVANGHRAPFLGSR